MELRNIGTFLRVAELTSFTKAAAELGYSQSTVTIQIKQLESELGFLLFDRIGRNVSLTPKGEEFISYANDFLRLEAKALSLRDAAGTVSGALRLGVLESLFVWKTADLLPLFHGKYPDVTIEIKSATGSALYRMLLQNELDIIYILDDTGYKKDCVRACAKHVDLLFVARPDHPLCAKRHITLAEAAREPLILAERDAVYRRELDREAAKRNVEIIPMLEIDNLEVVLRLVKGGMGISFIPDYAAAEARERGELATLDVDYGINDLCSQLIYHKNKFLTPQMLAFIRMIRESAAA